MVYTLMASRSRGEPSESRASFSHLEGSEDLFGSENELIHDPDSGESDIHLKLYIVIIRDWIFKIK